jgi:hypothetical protein
MNDIKSCVTLKTRATLALLESDHVTEPDTRTHTYIHTHIQWFSAIKKTDLSARPEFLKLVS